MKFRNIITSILAAFAILCGCTPMELIQTAENVKAEPSYLEIAPDGGEVKSTVIAGADWKITEIPEWLTVSPVSGSATDANGVQVTFSAGVTYESRTAQVLVTAGEEAHMITIKQGAAIAPRSFEAGDYWIIAKNSEGKYKAAMPVASGYGYLAVSDPEEVDGKLQGKAGNIFTFTAVEGGYTITDTYGNYYYLSGDYDSFNVTKTEPTDGSHIWTVEAAEGDAWKIMNSLKGKYMQLDASYGTYGCYSASKGTMPLLVKVEIEIEPEPLGDATDIKDIVENEPEVIIEGLVTATCTRGVIITDETASVYAYGAPEVALGDKVKLLGTFSNYNKGYQLKDITQHEVVSTGNEVKYPDPVVLTESSISGLIKPAYMLAQYASVKGIVEVDSYNNALIAVGDYKVKTNYYADSFADYKDKAVELRGYVISYKESAGELNMVVTSFEELADWVPEVEGKNLPFEETFAAGQGEFTIEGDVVWSASSYGSDAYMKASGYVDGAKTDAESMLVSPVIDLSEETAAYLSFDHTGKFFGTMTDEATVWAKKYEDEEWTKLVIPVYMTGSDYTFVNSGDVDLKDFLGSKMQFAFKYVSTTEAAGTWEVMNVKVLKEKTPAAGDGGSEEGSSNVLTITDADFPAAYPAEEATITVGGVDFKILNVANYGNGIQIKKETGYIASATDNDKIATLKLTWEKNFYPENLTVTVGSAADALEAAPTPASDADAMSVSFDLSAGDYKFFKIANTSTYATYLKKIEITYAE